MKILILAGLLFATGCVHQRPIDPTPCAREWAAYRAEVNALNACVGLDGCTITVQDIKDWKAAEAQVLTECAFDIPEVKQ